MNVHFGGILHSYTGDRAVVPARGGTLGAVIDDLERRHPGLKFRVVDEQEKIRPHIAVFVGTRATRDLRTRVAPDDDVHIVAALSGG